MLAMAAPKKRPKYPSEEKVRATAIPTEYYLILESLKKANERSVSWYVRTAVREWLERNGHLESKSK